MALTILAIETATDACSVALLINESITERYLLAPRQHNSFILSFIESLLSEYGLGPNQLDAIAFGCGPGSFTGVRIAAGVTQSLAFAWDLPAVPISTMRTLAQGIYEETASPEPVLVVMNAQREEMYWGAYRSQDSIMTTVCPDRLDKFSGTYLLPPSFKKIIGVGDAWATQKETLVKNFNVDLKQYLPERYPRARDVAKLAAYEYKQGRIVNAAAALPCYLREEIVIPAAKK